MNETQRGVRDDTLLSSRKGSRVMTVDKNKYILSINGMSKSFGRNKVLKHINLNVKPGTIMGLMGENGAGKSTMMKCLFGTYQKDEGTIVLNAIQVNFSVHERLGSIAGHLHGTVNISTQHCHLTRNKRVCYFQREVMQCHTCIYPIL